MKLPVVIIITEEGVKVGMQILALTPSSVEWPLGKACDRWAPRSPKGVQAEVKHFWAILPGSSFNDQPFLFTQRLLFTRSVLRQILSTRSSSIPNIRVEAKVGDSRFCWTRESVPVCHNLFSFWHPSRPSCLIFSVPTSEFLLFHLPPYSFYLDASFYFSMWDIFMLSLYPVGNDHFLQPLQMIGSVVYISMGSYSIQVDTDVGRSRVLLSSVQVACGNWLLFSFLKWLLDILKYTHLFHGLVYTFSHVWSLISSTSFSDTWPRFS